MKKTNITIISIIAMLILITSINAYKNRGYEYIDYENEKGIAKKCISTNDGLICKKDKEIIKVKQFRKR